MNRYWSEKLKFLLPYLPGEQPQEANIIKLNTNENAYSPSPVVFDAIIKCLQKKNLHLYPDPQALKLKQTISKYYKINQNNVFIGNGSDEVLAHIFNGLFDQIKPIIFPDITYNFYTSYCSLYQINYKQIPLNDYFEITLSDYNIPNGGIIFANPNAITGNYLTITDINNFLKINYDSLVVIDEAYIDFGGESAISLIPIYKNLLVVQTFSKSRSLAGLRIGFAVGDPELILGLERVKNSFNSYPVNCLSLAAAYASINDISHFEKTCKVIVESRQWLLQELQIRGFKVLPSLANFLLVSHSTYSGSFLFNELRKKSILVRYFNQPRLYNFLRITIGTQDQCKQLIVVLDIILSEA